MAARTRINRRKTSWMAMLLIFDPRSKGRLQTFTLEVRSSRVTVLFWTSQTRLCLAQIPRASLKPMSGSSHIKSIVHNLPGLVWGWTYLGVRHAQGTRIPEHGNQLRRTHCRALNAQGQMKERESTYWAGWGLVACIFTRDVGSLAWLTLCCEYVSAHE